jgi:CDP-paratose 2-epimerase
LKYLITGGCGFLGSNLAYEVLRRKENLLLVDDLSRLGSDKNLQWLKAAGDFSFHQVSTSNGSALEKVVSEFRPDVIFHLAGQVAMTTSIENPRRDFETNALGSFNLLEAVRKKAPEAIIVYSSTNKVYGGLEQFHFTEEKTRYVCASKPAGFGEEVGLDFQSPYGCSKGAADQYMLDYARIFGLKTIVFRHSSIFGGRQFSSFDQGWVGWFIQKAIETERGTLKNPFTIAGNGKQVRDILFVDDLLDCYFAAVENANKARGQAFNIGGGMGNSLSLLELFQFLEKEFSIQMNFVETPWRVSDQKIFVADTTKAHQMLKWHPQVSRDQGLRHMIEWVRSSQN